MFHMKVLIQRISFRMNLRAPAYPFGYPFKFTEVPFWNSRIWVFLRVCPNVYRFTTTMAFMAPRLV